jgi:ankyrin repeat protein
MLQRDQRLLLAARTGSATGVTAALSAGADPNTRDAQGRTALNYAASIDMTDAERADIFKALFARGADPRRADHDGFTPLHEAAARGRHDVIALLLEKGADINAAAENGTTPLHSAVNVALSHGGTHTISFLLASGADAQKRNAADMTALDVARLYAGGSVQASNVVDFLETWRPGIPEAGKSAPPAEDFARLAAEETQLRLRSRAPGNRFKLGPK